MSTHSSRDSAAHSHAVAVSTSGLEFAETASVTLEWRLSGLKELYESTKGEAKSKCARSAVFGDADNLWEILFYPNSGSTNGDFASLYLSCLPTQDEKDHAINKRWVRQGLWWFKLEIRTLPDPSSGKSVTIATKDASDHTFAVKFDTLIIACTIQAQPQPPAGYWIGMNDEMPEYTQTHPSGGGLSAWAGGEGASMRCAGGSTAAAEAMSIVPEQLVSALAGMINYEEYADVEFVVPAPQQVGSDDEDATPAPQPTRRIFASKRMLERLHYFEMMFSWDENEQDEYAPETADADHPLIDSDQEEERRKPRTRKKRLRSAPPSPQALEHPVDGFPVTETTTSLPEGSDRVPASGAGGDPSVPSEDEGDSRSDVSSEDAAMSDAEAKAPPQPAPRGDVSMEPTKKAGGESRRGPKRRRVVITDAALSTWYAIIYWIYTDRIVFAPLSSCFNSGSFILPDVRSKAKAGSSTPSQGSEFKTRQDWIDAWRFERDDVTMDADVVGNGYPANGLVPVSAKAIYRLADKMDIEPLKLRAYQHIMANLTIDNIPFEVFSMFSSVYASIRRNWGEIRKSEALAQVWTQIRLGRHVGFEEVWPLIVGQLEFKPAT